MECFLEMSKQIVLESGRRRHVANYNRRKQTRYIECPGPKISKRVSRSCVDDLLHSKLGKLNAMHNETLSYHYSFHMSQHHLHKRLIILARWFDFKPLFRADIHYRSDLSS